MNQRGYIDFSGLFWLGVIVGVAGSVVAWFIIRGIILLTSHLEWT
jgi:hypothetical protein